MSRPRHARDQGPFSRGTALEEDAAARAAVALLPPALGFDARTVALTPLGGFTNVTMLLESAHATYVLRLPGRGTDRFIDRRQELVNAQAAHAAGIAPAIVFADPERGLMLSEHVNLPPVSREALRNDRAQLERCAGVLRRLHTTAVGFAGHLDPIARARMHVELLREAGGAPSVRLAEVLASSVTLQALIGALPQRLCHVDPDGPNFLDDGERTLLIDWEYSAGGDPAWDLADLSRENELDGAADEALLHLYAKGEPSSALRARFELWKPLCDLHWASWAEIQHMAGNAVEDFDWGEYASARLDLAASVLSRDDLGQLIKSAIGQAR